MHRPQAHATHGDAITDRLRIALSAESDSALARALGVSPATVSSWRNRDSRPYALCIDVAGNHGISLDWLLAGAGPVRRGWADDGPLEVRDDPAAPAPDAGAPGHLSYRLAALAAALERLDPAHADVILAAALARATDAQRIAELEQQVAALAHPRHKKRA